MEQLDQTLKEFVLRAVSDDYEDLDIILEDITNWASEHGLTVDRQAAARALEQLIREGYVQAYALSSGPPAKAEAVLYSSDALEELWFYVTPRGKQLARELQKNWPSQE